MRTLFNLIIAILMAGWIVSFAVFSIQNIQPVSIKFLVFESIQLPIGVLLAFCVSFGLIIGVMIPPFWQFIIGKKSKRLRRDSKNLY
jgi:putative membrane protein